MISHTQVLCNPKQISGNVYHPCFCTLATALRCYDDEACVQRLYDTILCTATVMVPCVLTSTFLQKQMHKLQQHEMFMWKSLHYPGKISMQSNLINYYYIKKKN